MKATNEWLQGHVEGTGIAPRIVCKDGASLSVQAGVFLYCTPKREYGPYTQVEVGYPEPRPLWWDDEEESVMGYVSVERVLAHINEHGGLE